MFHIVFSQTLNPSYAKTYSSSPSLLLPSYSVFPNWTQNLVAFSKVVVVLDVVALLLRTYVPPSVGPFVVSSVERSFGAA